MQKLLFDRTNSNKSFENFLLPFKFKLLVLIFLHQRHLNKSNSAFLKYGIDGKVYRNEENKGNKQTKDVKYY